MAVRLRPGNLGLKAVAIVMAVFFWAIVRGEQKGERLVSARIELRDVPAGLTVLGRSNATVLLRVAGTKRLLDGLEMDEVGVSLGGRRLREGTNILSLSPADVQNPPRGLEVLEVSPRTLRVQTEALVERDVPVQARLEGAPAPGFAVRAVRCSPATVRIAGPRSEVRAVEQAFTAPVSVAGRSGAFGAQASLEPLGRELQYVNAPSVSVAVEIARREPGVRS